MVAIHNSAAPLIVEAFGTAILVFAGCSSIALSVLDSDIGGSALKTGLAFGLTYTSLAYTIGDVSGCHLNPAISTAVFFQERGNGFDLPKYLSYFAAQLAGGFVGAFCLYAVATGKDGYSISNTYSLGENVWPYNPAYTANGVEVGAFFFEFIATTIFACCYLGSHTGKASKQKVAGIAVGLAYVAIHLAGFSITGVSINPARSLGPALVKLSEGEALAKVYTFLVAPLLGGATAGMIYRSGVMETSSDEEGADEEAPVEEPAAEEDEEEEE